jgi:hypothetical protein
MANVITVAIDFPLFLIFPPTRFRPELVWYNFKTSCKGLSFSLITCFDFVTKYLKNDKREEIKDEMLFIYWRKSIFIFFAKTKALILMDNSKFLT